MESIIVKALLTTNCVLTVLLKSVAYKPVLSWFCYVVKMMMSISSNNCKKMHTSSVQNYKPAISTSQQLMATSMETSSSHPLEICLAVTAEKYLFTKSYMSGEAPKPKYFKLHQDYYKQEMIASLYLFSS